LDALARQGLMINILQPQSYPLRKTGNRDLLANRTPEITRAIPWQSKGQFASAEYNSFDGRWRCKED